jgi:hypothetical protein
VHLGCLTFGKCKICKQSIRGIEDVMSLPYSQPDYDDLSRVDRFSSPYARLGELLFRKVKTSTPRISLPFTL